MTQPQTRGRRIIYNLTYLTVAVKFLADLNFQFHVGGVEAGKVGAWAPTPIFTPV
jgi:hypothetical protein